ncbi:hypothetical protein [Sphingomonas sp.]|uniref:hypothetical protein n=1 Tax=Sphingomonas sp. TaxID=28214 RepID=UPI002D0BE3BC|nr:hypothetical protein [Sphingomonas sp.]HWK36841.1 hypothetical protein [Sphingomonas sp.]
MRKATVASLLILCGSTAAIAHVATGPVDAGMQNWSGNNTAEPAPAPTPAPEPTPEPTPEPAPNATM